MASKEPKKRLKAAESRRALLDAGLDLLKSHGVAPGLDRVTLKEAIELSGVPRSTAYRLYEGGKGQLEEYRADLLADLDNSVDPSATRTAVQQTLAEVEPLIASGEPASLATALREVVRVAVNTNMESVADSLEWRVYMSSLASLGTGLDSDPDLTEAFRVAASEFGERFVDLFETIAGTFGIRTRPTLSLQDFGALASSVVEGVALRQHINPRLAGVKRPTGADGELQSWNAAAIAIEGLLLTWTERDPNATVSADLSTWTDW